MRSLCIAGRALVGGALVTAAVHAAEPAHDADDEIRTLRKRVDTLEQRDGELEQARMVERLQDVTVSVSLLAVGQRANNDATLDGTGESQLNYRADVAVSLPVGAIAGDAGELFAQIRAGQGEGLSSLRSSYSGVNATAFQLTGTSSADDSTALLAQAWYQANFPLGGSGDKRREFEITAGKLDPFVFFDQNAAADDESRKFLNSAFVHNPLLDAGGDTGADAFGFQPGLRLAYVDATDNAAANGISFGLFGAGSGAHFENTFSSPFAILQVATRRRIGGREGNYRLYAWRNGQAVPFNNAVATDTEKHAGWGFSGDQRVGGHVTLFARYGRETSGRVQFDRATTAGVEIGGGAWRRARDAIGFAVGRLHTSDAFHAAALTLDADNDGAPDFGYTPDASEQIYELYYRFGLSDDVKIAPDVQRIRQPAGVGAAPDMTIVGLRAQVTY